MGLTRSGALAGLVLAVFASTVFESARAESWAWPNGERGNSKSSGAGSGAGSGADSGAGSTSASTSARFFGGSAAYDSPYQSNRYPNSGRPRYEVTDPDTDDFTLPHPEDLGINRPINRPLPRPPLAVRPYPGTGAGSYPGSSPGSYPGSYPGPGTDRYDPGNVSKCKCVHAFNCEADGLQFGSCDAGKRYCCTKDSRGVGPHGARPAFSGPSGHPGVLTGPGGPTGIIGPTKGSQVSSPYATASGREDVLYGPRPTYFRPGPDFNRPSASASGPSGSVYTPRPTDYYNRRPYDGSSDYYNNYSPTRGPNNSPYRDYGNYNRDRGYGLANSRF